MALSVTPAKTAPRRCAATVPSSPNEEFVRSICAPWAIGDFSDVDWAHPSIEYELADGPSPGCWSGRAAMERAFRGVLNAYAEYHVVAEEIYELDDERVLVLHSYRGKGRTSGVEVGDIRARGADLFHITAGKVTRLALYWEREHALAALGLET
jgi:ketosteroid isomerase-like protein